MILRSLLLGLALLVSCEQPRVAGVESVLVTAPTYEGRVDAAIARAPSVRLSLDSASLLDRSAGKVWIDAPGAIAASQTAAAAPALLADATVRPLLLGLDEVAAAKALRDKGVELVVVHTAVNASVDRGRAVLSRLFHHDQLGAFQLVRVADGLLFYRVLDKMLAFTPQQAGLGVAYLRHRLSGKPLVKLPDVPSENGKWAFIATLRARAGGRELAWAFAQDDSFQGALEELATDLEVYHRRWAELDGLAPLISGMDGLTIELHRVIERAPIEPRDEAFLESFWELGVDGAFMLSPDQSERGFLPGAVSYTQSLRTTDEFLRRAASAGRMSEKRPWREPSVLLEVIRTLHYRELPGEGLVSLYRGVQVLPVEAITLERTRGAVLAAGDWWLQNLAPNGQVTYKMWPSENRYSDEYNHVRHELATWNLVQAWTLDPRPEYIEGARRALSWTNQWLVQEGDMSIYRFDNNQKLGSAVVGLLGIVDLAVVTGDRQHDELMKGLGRFTKFMQLENGKFNGYHVPQGHPYYGQTNDIVPGEAALALVRLAEYFDDDSWIEGLPKFWAYYRPWWNERVAKGSPESAWPVYRYTNETRLELVQFGPWTVMAGNAWHRRTGDVEAAKFALEVARWMVETYQYSSERAPYPDYIGGYYKMTNELPAMQAFCYAEGTAAAYQLALRMAPDQAPYFEKASREAVRFAMNMQYDRVNTYPFTRLGETLGGIRYALNETKVRVDYTYHAQSAMYQWYLGALSDPSLSDKIRGGLPVIAQPTGPAAGLVPWVTPDPSAPPPEPLKLTMATMPSVGGRPHMINRDPNKPIPELSSSAGHGDDEGGE